jgi:hypothetical protein
MLVGAISGPMLDGVLVTEWKLLCVRHEGRERASKGPGESVEAVDIVSKSGVPGSKYGLVVLMNVTGKALAELQGLNERGPTMLGDIHPDGIFIEGVLVCVEALQRILVA